MSETITKENLFELYWLKALSLTQIASELNLDNATVVSDLLKRFGIPVRSTDIVKTFKEIQKQQNTKNVFGGATFKSNGAEIISESFNTEDYKVFFLFTSLNKVGSPTGAYIRVEVEFSFDEKEWYPLRDPPWNYYFESNNTIPVSSAKTGNCPGKFQRIKLTGSGINLSATAYFIITKAVFVFM